MIRPALANSEFNVMPGLHVCLHEEILSTVKHACMHCR